MVAIKNCSECNSIFNGLGELCRSCFEKEMNGYKIITNCISKREHKNITLKELSELSGISEKKIKRWIKEQKIFVHDMPNLHYECERCQQPIKRDRLCDTCKVEFRVKMNNRVYAI